jgi:hypothetical protein
MIGRHHAIVSIREGALGLWLRGNTSYVPGGDEFLIAAYSMRALRLRLRVRPITLCPPGRILTGLIPGISCLATIVLSLRDKVRRVPAGTFRGASCPATIDWPLRDKFRPLFEDRDEGSFSVDGVLGVSVRCPVHSASRSDPSLFFYFRPPWR